MAKVVVGPAGIETISGALMKPKKQEGHKCGNYLVATHRTAPTTSGNCQRLYAKRSDAYERSTSPGANELRARARFTAVAAAVKARSKNLSLMTSDQQAFLAQKDLADGKKTLKAYYWKVCGQQYDQEHGQG